MLSLQALGENLVNALTFVSGDPRLSDTSPLSASMITGNSSVCVSSLQEHQSWWTRATLIQYELFYIYKDPTSKYGYFHRYWGLGPQPYRFEGHSSTRNTYLLLLLKDKFKKTTSMKPEGAGSVIEPCKTKPSFLLTATSTRKALNDSENTHPI